VIVLESIVALERGSFAVRCAGPRAPGGLVGSFGEFLDLVDLGMRPLAAVERAWTGHGSGLGWSSGVGGFWLVLVCGVDAETGADQGVPFTHCG
jgi:hypothetical protein